MSLPKYPADIIFLSPTYELKKYLVSRSTEVHIQMPSPLNVFLFNLGFFNDTPELVHLQGFQSEVLLEDGSGPRACPVAEHVHL